MRSEAIVESGARDVRREAGIDLHRPSHRPAKLRLARRRVQLAREVLELAPQLLVLEDLLERRRFELLDGLERRRAVAHQVAQL